MSLPLLLERTPKFVGLAKGEADDGLIPRADCTLTPIHVKRNSSVVWKPVFVELGRRRAGRAGRQRGYGRRTDGSRDAKPWEEGYRARVEGLRGRGTNTRLR